jgi:hypothetical protein
VGSLPIESCGGVDPPRLVSRAPCHSHSIPIEGTCLLFLTRVVLTSHSFGAKLRAQFSDEYCLMSNAGTDFLIQRSRGSEGGYQGSIIDLLRDLTFFLEKFILFRLQ